MWFRNRFVWVAVILAATAGAVVLFARTGSEAKPADLRAQLTTWMRTTLESSDPGQHNHAGHAATDQAAAVVCGVRVYGFEPAGASAFTDVRKVYGFHLCGVAEAERPWDVAVKLAGPVILDPSTEPAGIQVVEATEDVRYADRLAQLFPEPYATQASTEALTDAEMADMRRRYDAAAGL